MLRELAGMLFEHPKEGGDVAHMGVSVERTAQVAGLQALLVPIVTAPLLLINDPTEPIGDAGWFVAIGVIAAVVAIGASLVRAPNVSVRALAASNVFTGGVLALLTWLTGGFGSPFAILFPLLAASITPHRPRVRRALIAWILVCVAAPIAYEPAVSADNVAELIMIGAASVTTLLTMVWLSSRVGRSEEGLMQAISTARAAQAELADETERLLDLNLQRDRLLSRVSHELRTPLTSVKGYVEALLSGERGNLQPEQRELAAVALRNSLRLELLIADLLLLSHVEAGQLKLRPESIRLRESLGALAEELDHLASERGNTLIVEAPEELRWSVDSQRLDQAVTNLIANAIKYSSEGGAVLIRARQVSTELWIEVVDKGVGIPKDEIPRLGERYFRASTAGTASGTGLGIAITRELIDLHRGVLEIESEVGSGSIFRIRIPGGLDA
jgi:signal transduction histidine kinase